MTGLRAQGDRHARSRRFRSASGHACRSSEKIRQEPPTDFQPGHRLPDDDLPDDDLPNGDLQNDGLPAANLPPAFRPTARVSSCCSRRSRSRGRPSRRSNRRSWYWGVQDSNLRRQSHLIYSQAPLTARETPPGIGVWVCRMVIRFSLASDAGHRDDQPARGDGPGRGDRLNRCDGPDRCGGTRDGPARHVPAVTGDPRADGAIAATVRAVPTRSAVPAKNAVS